MIPPNRLQGKVKRMPLEMELKYLDVDHDALRERLQRAGAACTDEPYFERNTVFDDMGRGLKKRHVLLRLRLKKGKAVLTLKRPPAGGEGNSKLKIHEELETGLDNPGIFPDLLETLGFVPAFRYEKIREKWSLNRVTVCLDTLPFGSYVELEGDEASVPAVAKRLGLGEGSASKETYHALNRRLCAERGQDFVESFVFDPAALQALGLDADAD